MSIEFDTVVDLLQLVAPLPNRSVVVGAWVTALYRLNLKVDPIALATLDLDFALGTTQSNRTIHADWLTQVHARLAERHYKVKPRGPVCGSSPFTILIPPRRAVTLPRVEVISELPGGGRRPPRTTNWFRDNYLVPQEVRDLEVLFADSWSIDLPAGDSIPVPNPLALVLHKALIRGDRAPDKRVADFAAVLETACLFENHKDHLDGLLERLQESGIRVQRILRKARPLLGKHFLDHKSSLLESALSSLSLNIRIGSPAQAVDLLRGFLAASGEKT